MQIPQFLEVQNAISQTVALLSPEADKLKDCWIDNRLNEECTLTFFLPMFSPKWQDLTAECRIIAGDREFVLLKPGAVDIERDSEGKLWGKVTAIESWALLNKKYVTISNDPQNPNPPELAVIIVSGGSPAGGYPGGSAGSALTYLLQGSGWSLDVCDVTGVYDLETEKESLLANIRRVQEIWGGFLVWDSINKTLSLRDETGWQEYRGFQIRYQKNIKGITRTVDYDIITRLWPFGEDDLDIASVNNGVKYLEDFSYTSEVLEGIWRDQGIGDQVQLKAKAQQVLGKACKPRYNYRIQVVDLRALPEWAHEDFMLGDMVDVIDEEMGVAVRLRIIRHRYNVFRPWQCEVEVGDPIIELKDLLASSIKATEFVKDVLRPNPSLSNLWKGFVNTFATVINSANGKLVWNDTVLEAIEIDQNGLETGKRVRLTPGGIGISTDGGQTYVTAITGDGVLANRVIANGVHVLGIGPGGINIEGGLPDSQIASASAWNAAVENFNLRNDRIGVTPANPVVATDGSAVDHALNTDGSANISFEWQFSGNGDAYNIDGFLVYAYESSSSSPYTFGTDPANEHQFVVTAEKRVIILRGVPANRYYTFGIQSYRMVDQDVNPAGILKSGIVKPTAAGEDPYRPSASVAFQGDVTGTIAGVSASVVAAHPSASGGAIHGLPSYVKLLGDGLHCYDDLNRDRAHFGGWLDNSVTRYGMKLLASDGSTVLVDDRGLLQTWQEGRADNVDATHSLVLNVYIPPETRQIKRALLRFRLLAFRTYSTGAASGGGHTSSTEPSRLVTATKGNTLAVTGDGTYKEVDSLISSGMTVITGSLSGWVLSNGSHSHSASSGNSLTSGSVWTDTGGADGHKHPFDVSQLSHSHAVSVSSSGSHTHDIYGHRHHITHEHEITIPSHNHTVYNHTHPLAFGIYEDTSATGVTVKINGIDRTSALGGPFSADQTALNITAFLVIGQWNQIELGSTRLGRLDATVFIQALMGV